MINDFSSFMGWYSNVLLRVLGFNYFFDSLKCNWWFQAVDIHVTCYHHALIRSAVYDSNLSSFSIQISFSFGRVGAWGLMFELFHQNKRKERCNRQALTVFTEIEGIWKNESHFYNLAITTHKHLQNLRRK